MVSLAIYVVLSGDLIHETLMISFKIV